MPKLSIMVSFLNVVTTLNHRAFFFFAKEKKILTFVFSLTGIETMIGTMEEDVKEIEIGIENVTEIGTEKEIGTGIETAIVQEMKKIMGERGSERGIGMAESGREETETVDDVGVVQGVGVEIGENETVKMVITVKGVLVAVQALGGGLRKMVVPGRSSLGRRRKRKRKRVMELITLIQRLQRLTDFVLHLDSLL